MIKSFEQAISESTCHKRKTVCELYDENDNLLSRESNRCEPTGGKCYRIGITQDKNNYDKSSDCNWTHCEINAIRNLPKDSKPTKAILYGHDFYCVKCEDALKISGVKVFEIQKPTP